MVSAKRQINCLIQKNNWHYDTKIIIQTDKFMETTFDKFITNNVKQKTLFEKEYAEFSHSERVLENLDREQQMKPFAVKSKTLHKRYAAI